MFKNCGICNKTLKCDEFVKYKSNLSNVNIYKSKLSSYFNNSN